VLEAWWSGIYPGMFFYSFVGVYSAIKDYADRIY
jgi:hypothetical protein